MYHEIRNNKIKACSEGQVRVGGGAGVVLRDHRLDRSTKVHECRVKAALGDLGLVMEV